MSTSTSTEPRVGDRVRLVAEGLWESGTVEPIVRVRREEIVSLEILEPAKPAWQDGDVVRLLDPDATAFRKDGQWLCTYGTHTHSDDFVDIWLLNHGGIILVRAGQVVTQ